MTHYPPLSWLRLNLNCLTSIIIYLDVRFGTNTVLPNLLLAAHLTAQHIALAVRGGL